jgi:hypothetical protein
MTGPLVIGVDPGGADTGITVRRGRSELVRAVLLTREDGTTRAAWVEENTEAVMGLSVQYPDAVVATEDVNPPRGHAPGRDGHLIKLDGLIDTAAVLGGLIAVMEGLVIVPPGGNGAAPLTAYPVELRPTRGKGAGRDNLRHLRSAWDVAGAATFRSLHPHLGAVR